METTSTWQRITAPFRRRPRVADLTDRQVQICRLLLDIRRWDETSDPDADIELLLRALTLHPARITDPTTGEELGEDILHQLAVMHGAIEVSPQADDLIAMAIDHILTGETVQHRETPAEHQLHCTVI